MASLSPEYTSDSDVSEDTRELVRQDLVTVKRKRKTVAFRTERLRERPLVPDMDTSQIRHTLHHEGAIGATSTQSFSMNEREILLGQNYNINIFSQFVSTMHLFFLITFIHHFLLTIFYFKQYFCTSLSLVLFF